MTAPRNSDEFVDQIFVDDKIDHQLLKEFLKLISIRVHDPAVVTEAALSSLSENSEKLFEGPSQVEHLSDLIRKCEERLAKLAETPKTRIVIRNEGEKLQSIIDSVESVRLKNCYLKAKIEELFTAHKDLEKVKCESKHPDLVDSPYQDSVNSDMCKLRRMYYGVQNQVDELTVKCNSMQQAIKDLEEKIALTERVPILEDQLNMLLDWRESLREEFNLFAERYEHVKTVKAGKMEVQELLENKVSYCHLSRYVPRDAYTMDQQNFINKLKELKDFFCELQLNFSARFVTLHKDVQMLLSRLATKRTPH